MRTQCIGLGLRQGEIFALSPDDLDLERGEVHVRRQIKVFGGKPTTSSLLLTTRERKALNRNYFNTYLWRPALTRASVPDRRENGCHALRHFFASTALHEGETIRAVSEYLSHADQGFTLRTYKHLMEGSSERTNGPSTPSSAPHPRRRPTSLKTTMRKAPVDSEDPK